MPLTYQCSNVVLQGNNTSHISATLSATNQIWYGCDPKSIIHKLRQINLFICISIKNLSAVAGAYRCNFWYSETPGQEKIWKSMGAQFIKHIIWDDLATSGWKHLFPMQSNLEKFVEIWRFILLIRSLFRWAGWQNLNAVVWVLGNCYGLINFLFTCTNLDLSPKSAKFSSIKR